MTSNRTTKSNGAAQDALATMTSFLTIPGFAFSTKIALEAARFSAQRMRAYADQMEALASCTNPADIITMNAQFLQQAQAEYVAETQTLREIMAASTEQATQQRTGATH